LSDKQFKILKGKDLRKSLNDLRERLPVELKKLEAEARTLRKKLSDNELKEFDLLFGSIFSSGESKPTEQFDSQEIRAKALQLKAYAGVLARAGETDRANAVRSRADELNTSCRQTDNQD
jgi:hypothetical protein